MRTVYPIKQKHLDLFLIMMNRNAALHSGYDLRTSGNWRLIQKYDVQDLKQIGEPLKTLTASADTDSGSGLGTLVTILLVVFAAAIAFLYVWVFFLGAKNNSNNSDNAVV